MGDYRPSLFSRGCIAVLIGTLVLLTAYMFAAPAKRSAWPGGTLAEYTLGCSRHVKAWQHPEARHSLSCLSP